MIRIFTHFCSSDDTNTANYLDVECLHWEVKGRLLAVQQKKFTRYFPLVHIKSFHEI